jgi:DNA-binding MarR family transcriptional regulator
VENFTKRSVISLLRAGHHVEEQLHGCLQTYGLSVPQFNVLLILRGQKEQPVSLATVQDRMIKKMSNTSRLIDKLIDKQLVSRNTCAANRRKVDICITASGLDLLKTLDPLVDLTEKNITSELNAEEQQLLNLLLQKIFN